VVVLLKIFKVGSWEQYVNSHVNILSENVKQARDISVGRRQWMKLLCNLRVGPYWASECEKTNCSEPSVWAENKRKNPLTQLTEK